MNNEETELQEENSLPEKALTLEHIEEAKVESKLASSLHPEFNAEGDLVLTSGESLEQFIVDSEAVASTRPPRKPHPTPVPVVPENNTPAENPVVNNKPLEDFNAFHMS